MVEKAISYVYFPSAVGGGGVGGEAHILPCVGDVYVDEASLVASCLYRQKSPEPSQPHVPFFFLTFGSSVTFKKRSKCFTKL